MRGVATSLMLLLPLLAGCIQIEVGTPATSSSSSTTDAAPPLQVSFTSDPPTPRVGQTVVFTLQVQGLGPKDRITAVTWDFGDGSTSTQHHPIHTFTTNGVRDVGVMVRSALGAQGSTHRPLTVLGPGEAAPPSSAGPALALLVPPTLHTRVEGNMARFTFEGPYTPDAVSWDFGDGVTSSATAAEHRYLSRGNFTVHLRLLVGDAVAENSTVVSITSVPFQPHVLVGVADSGFNVYHEVYRRPHMTAHPCTYIRDYPCGIPALNLTFDAPSWDAAFQADKAKWEAIRPGDRFWIPGTNIVGAVCSQPYEGSTAASTNPTGTVDYCILDDTSMHGTGTSSSVLSENPDALLVVVEGNSGGASYLTDGVFPIDIISHSWGSAAPLPVLCSGPCQHPLFVLASGNEGAFPAVLDGDGASTNTFIIGAADAGSRTEPGYSGWKTMDYVSEYCRPTAQTRSFSDTRAQYCGTSFSAPTFAGALSRVVLELRLLSGYDGSLRQTTVDPMLGITVAQIREAINRTATYTPEDQWNDSGDLVPLVAPWYQWGWGYYDRTQVDETMVCLLKGECPTRPIETVTYMEALWAYRSAT